MYILQAILLILKLIPKERTLFSVGNFLHFFESGKYGIDNGLYVYSYFSWISWWIILIPSYFILAKAVKDSIFSKTETIGKGKK
jgi:hypothetical protein